MNEGAAFLLVAFGLGSALFVTLLVEIIVAAFFRVGWLGIAAVVLVNLVTNPVLGLIVIAAATAGVGLPAWASTAVLLVLEIAIVLLEWRLLVWALNDAAGSSRKLLVLSIVMNAASFLVGALLLGGLSLT
jgi:hypothetical protein